MHVVGQHRTSGNSFDWKTCSDSDHPSNQSIYLKQLYIRLLSGISILHQPKTSKTIDYSIVLTFPLSSISLNLSIYLWASFYPTTNSNMFVASNRKTVVRSAWLTRNTHKPKSRHRECILRRRRRPLRPRRRRPQCHRRQPQQRPPSHRDSSSRRRRFNRRRSDITISPPNTIPHSMNSTTTTHKHPHTHSSDRRTNARPIRRPPPHRHRRVAVSVAAGTRSAAGLGEP